jgi:hypothetical protein
VDTVLVGQYWVVDIWVRGGVSCIVRRDLPFCARLGNVRICRNCWVLAPQSVPRRGRVWENWVSTHITARLYLYLAVLPPTLSTGAHPLGVVGYWASTLAAQHMN